MKIDNHFYRGRIALNVLAKNAANAKDVYNAAEGYVLIGVLSKNYKSVDKAVASMKKLGETIDNAVSIGLGSGDNEQAKAVEEIAKLYSGCHINQVFSSVGRTRANLGGKDTWINALVSPTGKPGYVNVSTGPISSKVTEKAIIPVKSAIALVRDMGGNALKYFPMNGLFYEEEFRAIAEGCGEENFPLEPTGGIHLNNVEKILQISLEAKVPKIIPHIYSSIIDKQSGETRIEDVKKLLESAEKVVEAYG